MNAAHLYGLDTEKMIDPLKDSPMNKKFLFGFVLLLFVAVMSVWSVRNKLTFLEYSDISNGSEDVITVNDVHVVLRQDFVMPYEIMHGLSIKIGTFGRVNNSEWDVAVTDPKTHKALYSKHFNASLLTDNGYYYIEFDKNIRLTKNSKYQIRISASKVNNDTSLAYYVAKTATESGLSLTVAGKNYESALCIKIYGGDSDSWWEGFVLFLAFVVFQLMLRIYYVAEIKRAKWLDDGIVQGCATGIAVFLLLFSFCTTWQFIDELDNIKGGIAIANGGVLYRDYVSQHPPFVYYLCSIFALFGAKSAEQFRLLYYVAESVIWGLLYIRHKSQFGYKMLLLPVFECVIVNSMMLTIQRAGCMILSDGVQGLCFVALILELLKFCHDKTLNWGRAVIVSICIWGSVGSAFLSFYVLVWIVVAFIILELKNWQRETLSLNKFTSRYWKLLTAILLPPLIIAAYFALNGTLTRAFEQFYLFNREVYPRYISGFGNNVAAPFLFSVRNLFDTVVNDFNSLMNAQASTTAVLHLLILVIALSVLVCMLKNRQYLESGVLFAAFCCAGSRGFADFHGLAAWYIAVMIIVLFYREMLAFMPKFGVPVLVVAFFYSTSIYVHSVCDNLLYEQPSVSEFERYVVSASDDQEKLFVDSWACNTLYFSYKNRQDINTVPYIIPWYMDWYEQDIIDDVLENKPRIVVFNEESDVWGRKHFAANFAKTLKQYYKRLSDNPADGWKYFVWEINPNNQTIN